MFLTDSISSMILPKKLTGKDDFMEFLIRSSPIKIYFIFSGFYLSYYFPFMMEWPQGIQYHLYINDR